MRKGAVVLRYRKDTQLLRHAELDIAACSSASRRRPALYFGMFSRMPKCMRR